MEIVERSIQIRKPDAGEILLTFLPARVYHELGRDEIPVRFVVTETTSSMFHCEVGVLRAGHHRSIDSIFSSVRRTYENTDKFNIVLVIPTGIGCELGGHSGDGGSLARLLGSVCDELITHPNVVNAADINEMPENGLYVEGSVLSRFMLGAITLQKVRSNRVLLVVDKHEDYMFTDMSVNSVSAARVAMGLDCPLVVIMDNPIIMKAEYSSSGRAVGRIERFENLLYLLEEHKGEYDAVALSTLIQVPIEYHMDYFKEDTELTVNPWGGVEAMLTHSISSIFNVPSAHSPMMTSREILSLDVGMVDPRKAAEAISATALHCVLKGLHRAPRILPGVQVGDGLLSHRDISCLVIPDGCVGLPVLAALHNDIPVVAVKDRGVTMKNSLDELPFKRGKLFHADNYLEAVGIVSALRAGVTVSSVSRPIDKTKVIWRGTQGEEV